MNKVKLGFMEIFFLSLLIIIIAVVIILSYKSSSPEIVENNNEFFEVPIEEDPLVEDPITEDQELSLDENISKLWFDLRRAETREDAIIVMEDLVSEVKSMMTTGILPQVVSSFPLVYVNGNETGFQRDSIYVGEEYYEVLTIVGPDTLGLEKVNVLVRKGLELLDLGRVPFLFSDYGLIGDNIVLAGDLIDPTVEDYLALQVVNSATLDIVDIELLDTTKVKFNEDKGLVRVNSDYPSYYFYTEYANEGIKEDPLYLILEGEQFEDYFQYEFIMNGNRLELKEIYNGADN